MLDATIRTIHHRRQSTTALKALSALAIAVALTACGGSGAAKDGDTGAAAPATQQTLSPTPGMGDTAANSTPSTGAPAMAGDTLGARGKAAGTTPPPPKP